MAADPVPVNLPVVRPEFVPFPKIARYNRHIIVTEKIDGTNAGVYVAETGEVFAASRARWLNPGEDNFGWRAWVEAHAEELRGLGPGMHFGEWYGVGIQRGYGLFERRFALFNVHRWNCKVPESTPPHCCGVVPVLYSGPHSQEMIDHALWDLRTTGSQAVPGFAKPEGVVVFHAASKGLFKITCERDEERKSDGTRAE